MSNSYEIEIKSLLGTKENAEKLKRRMQEYDPSCRLVATYRAHLNHYFAGGDLYSLGAAMTNYLDSQTSERLFAAISQAKDFSLRSRSADGNIFLVLKVAVDDSTSANGAGRLEFEASIKNVTLEKLDQLILSCGFSYQAKWSREREEYEFCGARVAIDKNAGYGYLAEFEIVTDDAGKIEETKADLRGLMAKVGAEELEAARLERMFAYYNSHWPEYYGTGKVFTVA